MYVSWLKKKLFFFLCSHTHTNYLSQMRQHSTLSFLFSSPRTTLFIGCLLSLSSSLLAALFFSLSCVAPCCYSHLCSLCGNPFSLFFNMRHTQKLNIYCLYILPNRLTLLVAHES